MNRILTNMGKLEMPRPNLHKAIQEESYFK